MIIQDGGTGKTAVVDSSSRLLTRTVQQSQNENATDTGESFNINSSVVILTSDAESGILYLKNNENRNIHLDSVVVILGPSTGGMATDTTRIRMYRNPTTGTLISLAMQAPIIENRNFGSSRELIADVYKGAVGATVTDGAVIIESLVSPGSRVGFGIDLVMTKGDSFAVTYEPNDNNTSMKVMAAYAVHVEPVS